MLRLRAALLAVLLLSLLSYAQAQPVPLALQIQQQCAGPCPTLGLPGYSWDVVQQSIIAGQVIPPLSANQDFILVGKTDTGGSSVNCNPCSQAQALAIVTYEGPALTKWFETAGNQGQLMVVGNEPNLTMTAAVYAAQYSAYYLLIHPLDPTAEFATGGLLGIGYSGSQGTCCSASALAA